MKSCKDCDHKKTCVSICPEIEARVSADHVSMAEYVDDEAYASIISTGTDSAFDDSKQFSDVWVIAKMYWTDKASPAEIAANVGSSPKEILKIISGLQLVVDAAIRNDVKSDLYKIAARMYFYERKDISGIASDMGLTYSDVWHFLKRFTDKIDGQSPEVCKLLTYLGGA